VRQLKKAFPLLEEFSSPNGASQLSRIFRKYRGQSQASCRLTCWRKEMTASGRLVVLSSWDTFPQKINPGRIKNGSKL
jgi:hypothetical protein